MKHMSEKAPTYHQIDDQIKTGSDNYTVLLRRSPNEEYNDGWISTGHYTGVSNQTDGPDKGKYKVLVNGGYKWVSADNLTDETQEDLARELSGESLREDEANDDTLRRAELERRLGGGHVLGAKALNAMDVAQTTHEKVFGRFPILRSYKSELDRIARVRAREEDEGYRYGMDQYTTSRQMIDNLVALVRQTEKYKPGEDLEGDILRYINA